MSVGRRKGQKVRVRPRSQADLFITGEETPGSVRERDVGYDSPDPSDIFIGEERLDRYLEARGLGWVLMVREVLWSLDWTPFDRISKRNGRRPYSPQAMMGLLVYGTMSGDDSLRQLERLARADLGAMWVCGGIAPDHSSIGRFVQAHAEALTGPFFEDLTRKVLKRLGSKTKFLAGDGTVIEAAGSRFRAIKLEAARQAAQDAKKQAEGSPADGDLQQAARKADEVAKAAEARACVRRRSPGETRVCTTEPEAPMLKMKRGTAAFAYVPSVLANEDQIIVAQHVEPTSELAAVDPLLTQAERVGGPVEVAVLDGLYCRGPVLKTAEMHNTTLLCPRKNAPETTPGHKFRKSEFRYDEALDCYRCPGGQALTNLGPRRRSDGYATTWYSCSVAVCRKCPLRLKCVESSGRRRIERFDHEEYLDALQILMSHSRAKPLLARRRVMVEPVFASLRGVQRLIRFRRFGLAGVRVGFALHAAAHNVRRLIARTARTIAAQAARCVGALSWAKCLAVALWSRRRRPTTSKRLLLPPLAFQLSD